MKKRSHRASWQIVWLCFGCALICPPSPRAVGQAPTEMVDGVRLDNLQRNKDFEKPITTLRVSPQGDLLFVGSRLGRVYDTRTFNSVSPWLRIPGSTILDAAFTGDQQLIAIIGNHKAMHFVDASSWNVVATAEKPGWVWDVATHPRRKECVASGGIPTLRRYDMQSGQRLMEVGTDFRSVTGLQVFPSGQVFCCAGNRSNGEHVIELRDFQTLGVVRVLGIGNGVVERMQVSPDGSVLVVSTTKGVIKRFDVPSGQQTGEWDLQHDNVRDLRFFGSERGLIVGGWNRRLTLLDMKTGAKRSTAYPRSGGVVAVERIDHPTRLVIANGSETEGHRLSIFDLSVPGETMETTPAEHSEGGRGGIMAVREPVPDAEAVASARSELQTLLKIDENESLDFGSASQRCKLLLKLSAEETNPTIAYTMLLDGAMLAARYGDAESARSLTQELTRRFQRDNSEVASLVTKVAEEEIVPTDQGRLWSRWCVDIGDQWLDRHQQDDAVAMYERGLRIAARAGQKEAARVAKERRDRAQTQLKDFASVKAFRDKLREDPSDAAANEAWGRYLCFVVGDWPEGMTFLVNANDPALREVATNDMLGAKTEDEAIALARQWRKFSIASSDPKAKSAATEAARYWLMQAREMAVGIDQLRIDKAIDSLPQSDAKLRAN